MHLQIISTVVLLTAVLGAPVHAEVSLPNIFSDHMVLQQKQQNRLWGKADPGEEVTATIGQQSHTTTADENGDWEVTLDPLAVGEPLELVVQGTNRVEIADVLVGEVWICSGQSNMEWPMSQTNNYDLAKLSADRPEIRMINYPNVGTQQPVWTHPQAKWMVATPDNLGSFSAVGYYFGRQLHQALEVPIGLVNNAWGGSACEAWIPRDKLAGNAMFQPLIDRADKMADQLEELESKAELSDEQKNKRNQLQRQLSGNHRPANIYNGVLQSHMGYGIRGVVWYQGESNAGRAYQYRALFPRMISTWREEWDQGDFPFYWVQLADYMPEKADPADSAWAELREAQTRTMEKLPNTGEAVIIDLGEGKDIHPRNKRDVGLRLARWALANQYGVDVPFRSPRFDSLEIADGKAILSFDHVDGGWRPFDTRSPQGFAIAGADKNFVWAEAKILDNGQVQLWSDQVSEPVAVRYAWADNPVCNMYDQAGLPLTPFRTDDWPGVTADAR